MGRECNEALFSEKLGGRFGYFLYFLLFRGQGKGGRVRGEKGVYFHLERERGGGVSEEGKRGGAHRRREGVGGGGKFFFFGAEMSAKKKGFSVKREEAIQ